MDKEKRSPPKTTQMETLQYNVVNVVADVLLCKRKRSHKWLCGCVCVCVCLWWLFPLAFQLPSTIWRLLNWRFLWACVCAMICFFFLCNTIRLVFVRSLFFGENNKTKMYFYCPFSVLFLSKGLIRGLLSVPASLSVRLSVFHSR